MKKIEIRCPGCKARGNIEISEESVKNTKKGLFAINIAEGIICEHSFIAYVDKNFNIRDSFMADFQIELPDSISQKDIGEEKSSLLEQIDIDLIKLNLTSKFIEHIIKAIFHKKRMVIISEQAFLFDHITNFVDYITQNSFQKEMYIVTSEDYPNHNFGDHVAFQGGKIIRDEGNLFNPKNLGVEKAIVRKFLNDYDPHSCLILIKNEIKKAYELAKTIVEYLNTIKKEEKVYSKKMINEIKKNNKVKIQLPYLDFLYEIVEIYFEVQIPKSSEISNFLGTL